jgi:hypothetical protein
MAIHPIRVGEISALVSDVTPGGGSRSVNNALAHHAVVSHALACFPAVLPCRFGTLVPDEAGVVVLLRERHPRIEQSLDTLQGRVEIGIKAMLAGPDLHAHQEPESGAQEGRTPGERYLFDKRVQYHAARRLTALAEPLTHALREVTSPFVQAIEVEQKPLERGLMLTLCCLVERSNLTPLKQGYERVRQAYPQVRFLYSGPWPPYTFAAIDLT